MKSSASINLLLAAAVISMMTSCTSVVSKTAVGSSPAELDAEKWEGTWMTPDKHVVLLRVKDAAKGLIEVAWVEVKNDSFVMESHELHVRQHGGWLWANMKEGDGGTFLFGRISEPDDDQILGWVANPPAFAEAVRSGTLKGELMKKPDGKESGSVLLEGLTEANLDVIQSGAVKDAFVWDRPLVLMKLTSKK